MNRFYSGFMRWVVPVVFFAVIMAGCGGGGGSGDNSPGGGPSGGGGTGGGGGGGNNGNPTPPAVVSAVPTGDGISVHAPIEVTFSKPMRVTSFLTALNGLDVGYEAICVANTDCKTVRFSHDLDLTYDKTYTLILMPEVRDENGTLLPSSYQWSFKTGPFVPPPSFNAGIAIDGLNGKDSGECTALAVDSTKTVHIVYYSEFDGAPKHASCPSQTKDCSVSGNWDIKPIDLPVEISPGVEQKFGRDINLAIDGSDTLHVSYRDVGLSNGGRAHGGTNDGIGVLKYAKAVKSGANWIWSSPVIVDDTTDGVTDTYIAVNGGAVHISYRKKRDSSIQNSLDALAYATCSTSCDSTTPWPNRVEIDHGNEAGAPNHIVVTPSAIHVSYYLDRTLKYATCLTLNDCIQATSWTPVVIQDRGIDFVDSNGIFIRREDILDVGTENSIAIDNGTLHVTYRDNTMGSLKYARCLSGNDCTIAKNWDKQESKIMEIQNGNGSTSEIPIKMQVDSAGGSTQIKADGSALHVSYRDDANKDLKYARCLSNCLTPSQWSIQTLDAPGEVGLDTYLEVRNGQVYISYRDASNKDLKYTHGAP